MSETKREFAKHEESRRAIASLKRKSAVDGITAVHAVLALAITEPDFIPEYLLHVNELDALWSQYEVKDNVVLKCLVNLRKEKD